MSSWRPLAAGTVGLFLIILAFLAGQLKGGSDHGLRQNAAAATVQPTQQAPDTSGFGGNDPYGIPPDGSGAVPGGANPDLSPPTTHQS
jgi:hypothetical protein